MGEHDVRLGDQFAAAVDCAADAGPVSFRSTIVGGVRELLAGHRLAVELRGHLREDDVLFVLVGFADEDAAGLGESFKDQRGGHHREAGEVIREVIFGEAEVLDGDGRLAATRTR